MATPTPAESNSELTCVSYKEITNIVSFEVNESLNAFIFNISNYIRLKLENLFGLKNIYFDFFNFEERTTDPSCYSGDKYYYVSHNVSITMLFKTENVFQIPPSINVCINYTNWKIQCQCKNCIYCSISDFIEKSKYDMDNLSEEEFHQHEIAVKLKNENLAPLYFDNGYSQKQFNIAIPMYNMYPKIDPNEKLRDDYVDPLKKKFNDENKNELDKALIESVLELMRNSNMEINFNNA